MFAEIRNLLLLFLWIFGVVVAKGFWSSFFAITLFPYAWYLAVEHLLKYWGVI